MDIREKMKSLIEQLNEASKAYYQDGEEIISNFQYDKLYDDLLKLEKESGITLENSPSQNVGYKILSELPKERHPKKMLSLDKTKDREAIREWLGDKEGVLSWKLDGLTIVLTYENGILTKALTRGNGEIGEVVTENAKTFINLPKTIDYKGRLVLRGEAVISYADFDIINRSLPEAESRYKNPRNLCSGSVRQLNSKVTASRRVGFYAFSLVEAEDLTFKFVTDQFSWMKDQGFHVVEYKEVDSNTLISAIDDFEANIDKNPLASDGLVLCYNDIDYGKSLGETSKFPRNAIAFKWEDQTAETKLLDVEWSPSRTGLINPIALFEPVELEGTTVSRASLHNISIAQELQLGIGDIIKVYKANMIIPQVLENLSKSNNLHIPEKCPVCSGETLIKNDNGVKTLHCINPKCSAKEIKKFTLFVSRNAMNIDGLSEMTLEKFIDKGFIKEFADIFKLENYREKIISMEGFGEKSYENLIKKIDEVRQTESYRLLYALGIKGIGLSTAKLIAKESNNNWDKIESISKEELLEINGIGEVLADSYVEYFQDEENRRVVNDLLEQITFLEEDNDAVEEIFAGKTFVITGKVNHYKSRDEIKEVIEKLGGKVSGSVSGKTTYLINNDLQSNSGKNKKAKELNVPIISEDTLLQWIENKEVGEAHHEE